MHLITPESYGEFLRFHARYAKNTSERLRQISRVDALCWYLSKVSHASSLEVKRFMTAFKGTESLYSVYNRRTREHSVVKGLERAYALLNTCYGGVGADFSGRLLTRMKHPHYGPRAPLYRPLPRMYAPTIAGIHRAARVDRYVDACLAALTA